MHAPTCRGRKEAIQLEREQVTNENDSVDHARLAKERLKALRPAAYVRVILKKAWSHWSDLDCHPGNSKKKGMGRGSVASLNAITVNITHWLRPLP